VNAFIHTTLIHNYVSDRATLPAIDVSLPANVNIAASCGAHFNGSSINFFAAGGPCVNMAYSTVIAHEYGHFIVAGLGLAQGAFGEGYADTCGLMLYDTDVIGRDFCGSGCHVRNPGEADQQYPCSSGAIHACGQIIGGCVYDVKEALKQKYGPADGLELARQLHVDWSMITGGGIGLNSAHPQTAIEWLIVNDDDGNLDNGTPDYDEICQAFANHGIECPQVTECPGDLDADGDVDLGDLSILLAHFGTPSGAEPQDGDIDGDDDVDLADLSLLLANFGSTCA